MALCEKCWRVAYVRAINNTSKSQYEHYLDLIEENTMRLRCEKCNTYYSVKHSRGTQLKSLRCPKDSGLLVYMTFTDGENVLKDKYGFKWTYETSHLIPGQTVFVPVAGGVILNSKTSTEP